MANIVGEDTNNAGLVGLDLVRHEARKLMDTNRAVADHVQSSPPSGSVTCDGPRRIYAIHRQYGTIKELPMSAAGWIHDSEWVVFDHFPTREDYYGVIVAARWEK